MADETTIWVAGITAFTTLTRGWGGYRLAGRNEQARDTRAAFLSHMARPYAIPARHRRSCMLSPAW